MKKLHVLFLLFATLNLFAQDETIFGDMDRIGGFGGPIFEFSVSDNTANTAIGGGGAVILDNFFLGGYGIGGIDFSNNEFKNVSLDINKLDFGHGGLWLGFTPSQHKAIHPYAALKIGWGNLEYRYVTNADPDNEATEKVEDRIFALTPEAGVEINLFEFFRIAATAHYRWVDGVDNRDGFKDGDFSNFGATLTLRFGGFGYYR